jgi:hypothetical protein
MNLIVSLAALVVICLYFTTIFVFGLGVISDIWGAEAELAAGIICVVSIYLAPILWKWVAEEVRKNRGPECGIMQGE